MPPLNDPQGTPGALAWTPSVVEPPGWYGKLPALGDFASRRLPAEFISACDAFLLQGLSRCSDAFGSRWWERYRVAPVVRFWMPALPRAAPRAAWAGLVMPSMDRVGRHFPLTLAAPVPTLRLARRAGPWFDALEDAARSVLDLRRNVDDFEAALHALPPSPVGTGEESPGTTRAGNPEDEDDDDDTLVDAPLRSAWWCDDGRPHRFPGWPPPEAFVRVLAALACEEETRP